MKKFTNHLIATLLLFLNTVSILFATNCDGVNAYAGADRAVCSYSIKLDASSPVVGTGQWSILIGYGNFIDVLDPKTEVNDFANGENVFIWSVFSNGCISRDTVVITNNSPSKANAGVDMSIIGESTFLNGNNPVYGYGSWSVLNGSGQFENYLNPKSKLMNFLEGSNEYIWTIVNANCVSKDTVRVIKFVPIAVEAGAAQEICSNETTLSANIPPAGSIGEWSVIYGAGSFNNINDNKTSVRYIGPGRNVFQWTIRQANNSVSDTVVILNNTPTKANAGVDALIVGNEFVLNGNVPQIGVGKWKVVSGGGSFNNIFDPFTTIIGLNPEQNILRWTITNGTCVSNDDVVVTVASTTDLLQNESDCKVTVAQPNYSELIINVSGECNIEKWEITSILGLKLISESCNCGQISIPRNDLKAGVYVIRITLQNGSIVTRKILLS